jgi:RNA polymerase sigma factor (sigma-70 family)
VLGGAGDEAEKRELAQLLLEAIEQLPEQSAKLLASRSKDDITLEEAGERIGLSPTASRATASRAYKKLKGFLKKRMGS